MRKLFYIVLALFATGALAASSLTKRNIREIASEAGSGNPEAMFLMSVIYEEGYDTVVPDTARSLSLLRRSAEAGYAPAQNYLGFLYKEGKLLSQSTDSALLWIRKAADSGNPKAAHNLAYMILNGEIPGLVADGDSARSLAKEYLRKASDAGRPQSMTLLADMLAEGGPLPPDTLAAKDLYEKAIAAGFRDAELRLLNMMGPRWTRICSAEALSEGLRYWNMGAPVIAVELLRTIGPSDPETPAAYALLGHAASRGLGMQYDHHLANEYFARAALAGDPAAKFILAETLEIFPDLLPTLLPEALPEQIEEMDPGSLRAAAAAAGITTAEQATRHITSNR